MEVNHGVNYPQALHYVKSACGMEISDFFGGGSTVTILTAMRLNQYSDVFTLP